MGGKLSIADYLNAVLGWNYGADHYMEVGERVQNLRMAFNFKHGVNVRQAFSLPDRAVGAPPLEKGPMKGVTLQYQRLGDDFLKGMGWDVETGKPTREKLQALGLDKVADELWA